MSDYNTAQARDRVVGGAVSTQYSLEILKVWRKGLWSQGVTFWTAAWKNCHGSTVDEPVLFGCIRMPDVGKERVSESRVDWNEFYGPMPVPLKWMISETRRKRRREIVHTLPAY